VRHYLDLYNEPTIARIKGFFREESLAQGLWERHLLQGRLDASLDKFFSKNPNCTVTRQLIYNNLEQLGAPMH